MRTVHIEVNVDEEPVAGKPHGGFCEGLPLFFKVLEVQGKNEEKDNKTKPQRSQRVYSFKSININ
jgi:hypothetical protein